MASLTAVGFRICYFFQNFEVAIGVCGAKKLYLTPIKAILLKLLLAYSRVFAEYLRQRIVELELTVMICVTTVVDQIKDEI